MCDTIGIHMADRTLFAKNSDRSPNEPQVLEFHAAHGAVQTQPLTYMVIPGTPANAIVISRPAWMWGAEMGVNEHGLCIGNEAVFTKGSYGKTGLTGMDLLRLALERADSVDRGIEVLTGLLEQYGQGGDCGYDHSFFYDNAFLLTDRHKTAVLETCGNSWAIRYKDRDSISNRLSIKKGGGECTEGNISFTAKHTDPLYTHFSASASRLSQTQKACAGADSVKDLMGALRVHTPKAQGSPLCRGSVGSVCMHAGGMVGDHTTASLIVQVDDDISLWATGSSTPCISLFKPCAFGTVSPPVFAPSDPKAREYWFRREAFHRSCIGKVLPVEYYAERDALEQSFLKEAAANGMSETLSRCALEEETEFYKKWSAAQKDAGKTKGSFRSYWEKKDNALHTPARPFI